MDHNKKTEVLDKAPAVPVQAQPVATIDTPEFSRLLTKYFCAVNHPEGDASGAYAAMIAHIDAALAAAHPAVTPAGSLIANGTVDGGNADHNQVYVRMDARPSTELWTIGTRCHLATATVPALSRQSEAQPTADQHAAGSVEACPDCNGTGERDSGGVHPWGEPAMLPCDCDNRALASAQPVAAKCHLENCPHGSECVHAQPVAAGELPSLPKHYGHFNINGPDGHRIKGYTADQMIAYGQQCAASRPAGGVAEDDGPDVSGIDIPAGDRLGNHYEQLCAAWHREPCGDTKAAIAGAILDLHSIYEPPLDDGITVLQKANEFLSLPAEQGVWAGDIDGIFQFAQFFKAYGAPKVASALRELMSIVRIHSDEIGQNFAWAEMSFAEEVLDAATLAASAAQPAAELQKRVAELEAARYAYASEFPPNADGDPDVGSIHANIRALKASAVQPAAELAETIRRITRADWRDVDHLKSALRNACAAGKSASAVQAGAVSPVGVPVGWQLVPKHSMSKMDEIMHREGVRFPSRMWTALLAAAPNNTEG